VFAVVDGLSVSVVCSGNVVVGDSSFVNDGLMV